MKDLSINPDVEAAFNNAENYIANVKDEFLYMYSDKAYDFFKHIDTRKYQLVPKAQNS